jgi:hypothetical protein
VVAVSLGRFGGDGVCGAGHGVGRARRASGRGESAAFAFRGVELATMHTRFVFALSEESARCIAARWLFSFTLTLTLSFFLSFLSFFLEV